LKHYPLPVIKPSTSSLLYPYAPYLLVFLEAEWVVVAEPEVFALVFAVAEPSPEVVALVVGPEVVFVADPEVAEPEVAFLAPFSIVHVSGHQVSVHIHTAFAVLIPVSFVMEGVDIFQCSIFFLFPNIDYCSRLSNFFEDVDKESFGSPNDTHANYDLYSTLSNQSLYHNKNMGYICNKPNPDHNNVSDTNVLPIDATTNHPRKRCLHQCQVQRKHMYQVSLSPLGVLEI
jgi:hypothetical protein